MCSLCLRRASVCACVRARAAAKNVIVWSEWNQSRHTSFVCAYKGLVVNPLYNMYHWPLFQMAHTTIPDAVYSSLPLFHYAHFHLDISFVGNVNSVLERWQINTLKHFIFSNEMLF